MTATALEKPFTFLNSERGPATLIEALKHHGVAEIVGNKHNPVILAWADELNSVVAKWYEDDEKPWCGVFVGMVIKRCGFQVPSGFDVVRAREYLKVGQPTPIPMLWDILVFQRDGGGHVGFYVAECPNYYYVYGGNQKNRVCIVPIEKNRLLGARRLPYEHTPPGLRRVYIQGGGVASKNEA